MIQELNSSTSSRLHGRPAQGVGVPAAQTAAYTLFAAARAPEVMGKRSEQSSAVSRSNVTLPEAASAQGSAQEQRGGTPDSALRGAGLADQRAVIDLGSVIDAEVVRDESVSERAAAEMREGSPREGEQDLAGTQGVVQQPGRRENENADVKGARPQVEGRSGKVASEQESAKPAAEARQTNERTTDSQGEQRAGTEQREKGGTHGQRSAPIQGVVDGARASAAGAGGPAMQGGGVAEPATGGARDTGTVNGAPGVGRSQSVSAKWLERVSGSTARPTLAPEPMPAAIQTGRAMAQAIRDGEGTVTMRLLPKVLGPVTIRMTIDEGVVSAKIECSTVEARELLSGGQESLRTSMEARGLHVGTIELAPVKESGEALGGMATPDGSNTGSGSTDDGRDSGGERNAGGSATGGFAEPHEADLGSDVVQHVWLDPVSMRLEAWA